MVIFGFGELHDIPSHMSKSITAYRWAIEIDWFVVGLIRQNKRHGRWEYGAEYYTASIRQRWHVGSRHDYYNGPHCSFSLGFLSFAWSGDWCEKCMPPEKK